MVNNNRIYFKEDEGYIKSSYALIFIINFLEWKMNEFRWNDELNIEPLADT